MSGSIAAKVREYKERYPFLYCEAKGCLWRIRNADGDTISICKKHGTPSQEKQPMDDSTRKYLEGVAVSMAESEAKYALSLMTVQERRGFNTGEPQHQEFVRRFLRPVEELAPSLETLRWLDNVDGCRNAARTGI